jgi:hypothetical protein
VGLALKDFLLANGLIVTVIVLSFFIMRRSSRVPVTLDLNTDKKPMAASELEPVPDRQGVVSGTASGVASAHAWSAGYRPRSSYQGGAPLTDFPLSEKNLNVFFNWNGHSWDAYEVLGIPAGSSREAASHAFQTARGQCDPQSVPFLQAALDAILNS